MQLIQRLMQTSFAAGTGRRSSLEIKVRGLEGSQDGRALMSSGLVEARNLRAETKLVDFESCSRGVPWQKDEDERVGGPMRCGRREDDRAMQW